MVVSISLNRPLAPKVLACYLLFIFFLQNDSFDVP